MLGVFRPHRWVSTVGRISFSTQSPGYARYENVPGNILIMRRHYVGHAEPPLASFALFIHITVRRRSSVFPAFARFRPDTTLAARHDGCVAIEAQVLDLSVVGDG